MRWTLLIFTVFTLACSTTTHTPASDSRAEITEYVRGAAELVRENGPDACDALRRPEWFGNGWYVFVLDAEGRTICHPAQPQNVGRPAHDLVDANGKRFGDEFMQVAEQGGGWVDYLWPRANSSTPEAKSSYVVPVTGKDGKRYVVGSGGHAIQ